MPGRTRTRDRANPSAAGRRHPPAPSTPQAVDRGRSGPNEMITLNALRVLKSRRAPDPSRHPNLNPHPRSPVSADPQSGPTLPATALDKATDGPRPAGSTGAWAADRGDVRPGHGDRAGEREREILDLGGLDAHGLLVDADHLVS